MASWCDDVPSPVDTDGEVVPLLVKKLYADNCEALDVELIGFNGLWVVKFKNRNGIFHLDWFHLSKPDSWERLEEDARKTTCGYFGRSGLCVDCPAIAISKACNVAKSKDIVRRAKELAGVSGND